LFGPLPERFPRAWNALSRLANASKLKVKYARVASPLPEMPELGRHQVEPGSDIHVYASGIDAGFDAALLGYLRQIRERQLPFFFSDSFKSQTRNPEKLLRVID